VKTNAGRRQPQEATTPESERYELAQKRKWRFIAFAGALSILHHFAAHTHTSPNLHSAPWRHCAPTARSALFTFTHACTLLPSRCAFAVRRCLAGKRGQRCGTPLASLTALPCKHFSFKHTLQHCCTSLLPWLAFHGRHLSYPSQSKMPAGGRGGGLSPPRPTVSLVIHAFISMPLLSPMSLASCASCCCGLLPTALCYHILISIST